MAASRPPAAGRTRRAAAGSGSAARSFQALQICRERTQVRAGDLLERRHAVAWLQMLTVGDPTGDGADVAREGPGADRQPPADMDEIGADLAGRALDAAPGMAGGAAGRDADGAAGPEERHGG